MLYDEMVKRLTRAELALSNKDYQLFEDSVTRTKDILRYLIDTLDRSFSISEQLFRLYDFFMYELSRVSAGRNSQVLSDLKPMIIELRDTFKEANKHSGV